jgi:two-component system sensor histidine kinase HydH
MVASSSRFRRSLERAGPLGVALILGALLVVSSGLSYRDARNAAGVVAERQGIGLLHRVDRELGLWKSTTTISAAAVKAALEANQALGLLYIGVFDMSEGVERILVQAGTTLLSESHPRVGAPAFGRGRVRMVNHSPGGRAFDGDPFRGGPFEHDDRGPDGPPPAPPRPPHRHPLIVIEFDPIGSVDAVARALAVLALSFGAALLLTVAALILAAKARYAERAEAQFSAQRHLARLGEMSAVLAHEIRNPLAALKGHAQLLAEQTREPAVAARVERVVKEAVRLEQLTNDLLELVRSGVIRRGPAHPGELLQRAARATDPARVECAAVDAPESAQLDAGRIEQVLINLIENALEVTPTALKVQAEASADRGGALIFTVRDHGPGVPPAERARIFEPFHTTKTRGTGLGLAVASRIVELHGGRIDVLDADGGGALFRVYLPAREVARA